MTQIKLALIILVVSRAYTCYAKEAPQGIYRSHTPHSPWFSGAPRLTCLSGTAVEHMAFLSDLEENLSIKYMSYMSEVAHGERARKMEKRRQELLSAVRTAINDGNKLKPFEGDADLKKAYIQYWNVLLSVFNEDYHKIVDMEEIAEQSYDGMEAYLRMQEKAGQRLDQAYTEVGVAYRAFAAAHNVRLTEAHDTKLARKIQRTGQVNAYVHKLYLIHFKSTIQEGNMIDAFNKKDINSMEQSREAMKRYAEEGLARLDTVNNFKGDGSLVTAVRKVMEFQIAEASRITALSDFLVKADDYEKSKKAFDAKNATRRTQADIDSYNKSVNIYNAAVTEYQKVNDDLNKKRNTALNHWETTRKRFMDHHIPHK